MFRVILMMAALLFANTAHSSIFISEFMADVSTVNGDANQDGVISSSQDEFIELFNSSSLAVDVSGWRLTDAIGTRHVFASTTFIDPFARFVVFGGGDPMIGTLFQVASTGSLGLNNSGDTITLLDNHSTIIDQVIYGREAGDDQSMVREGRSEPFIKHSEAFSGRLYSPGLPIENTAKTVPEPATAALWTAGLLGWGFRRQL